MGLRLRNEGQGVGHCKLLRKTDSMGYYYVLGSRVYMGIGFRVYMGIGFSVYGLHGDGV